MFLALFYNVRILYQIMSGVIYFTEQLKYVCDDDFFTACRANLMYELFLYSNTDGVVQKK